MDMGNTTLMNEGSNDLVGGIHHLTLWAVGCGLWAVGCGIGSGGEVGGDYAGRGLLLSV
jgi:hypothetical protein